ncbi:MAG: Ysh1p: subunit of polyadenylation factor I [Ignavibacteriales bacterium]
MIQFKALGGAMEIGANSYYINFFGTGIILDCGQHPRKEGYDSLPDFSLIENDPIDYVIITHAHQDHLNSLPFLVKLHPYIQVITTPATRDIAELTLHNALNIMREELDPIEAKKLFSHDELDMLTGSIIVLPYNKPLQLAGHKHKLHEEITLTLHDAGHILGSAMVFLECAGRSICYTGDINPFDQAVIKGASYKGLRADILIMESTYGQTPDAEYKPWQKEKERLGAELNKVFNKGGSVLMPVFSLGKLQELLTTIWQLMHKRKVPFTDIYVNGIGMKLNRLYDRHRYLVNMVDPNFQVTGTGYRNITTLEKKEDLFKEPCIVMASSGMLNEGTLSYTLAPLFLRQKDCAIFTAGYMDPESAGYAVANAKKGDHIYFPGQSKAIPVKCAIRKFRFSAHSSAEGLVKIAAEINPERVILVHGDEGAVLEMGSILLKKIPHVKIHAAEPGKLIEL